VISMNGVNEYIDRLSSNEEQESHENEGDYRDESGLLICGVCHQKKERRIEFGDINRIVHCVCDCHRKKQEAEKAARQKEEDMRRIESLKKASLMDEKFRDATFSNFGTTEHNQKNLKLCRRYCDTFSKMCENNQGLLFWGNVGTGKSFAAACIAHELLAKGIPVVMTSFVKLLEVIQQGDDKESEIIRKLDSAKLVIFDDLGAERNTDYALEKVYNIIDSRYRSRLPMLLTTNLSVKDMMEEDDIRYKRIYDRIFEVCYPMEFTGMSWRKRIAGHRFEQMKAALLDD